MSTLDPTLVPTPPTEATARPLPTPGSAPSPWPLGAQAAVLPRTEESAPKAEPAESLSPRATINTAFFDFFTWSMVAMVALVVVVIVWGRGMIVPTFLHHIELNGIIGAITVYGIFRVYKNNASLYRTARYVKAIQDMERNPATSEADIARLVAGLKGPGIMLDIQNTEMALRRMLKSGFFVITDNDSRLIKSKIGSRVRYRYNHISFFAGILISFGLLGTFVGLIATVASVGEQMGMVSRSLASGQEMNIIDLITGISKPMEGMGTAFGASLFGLGGSMLLGGLNHVAGHAQDHFMENLSRWLDDRIPSLKGKTSEKVAEKTGVAASSTVGQAMPLEIGTFMVLAEDTHKQLRSMGGFMEDLAKTLAQQQASTIALQHMHQQHAQQMQALQTTLANIPAVGQQLAQAFSQWQGSTSQQQQAHTTQLAQVLASLGQLPGTGEKLGAELREWRNAQSQQLDKQSRQEAQIAAQIQNLALVLQGLKATPLQAPETVTPKQGGMFGLRKS